MPKPKYLLSEYNKKEIFKKICIQVGFPIFTKLDCKKVSELITDSGFSGISESTIYRLFLWKGNTNRPYLHTLNTLAEFCGYSSWNDFELQQQEIDSFVLGYGKFQNSRVEVKSLISICIHENELKPLYAYTEQFETIDDFEIKSKFAKEIFNSTLTNSNNEQFFKTFHHFPIIREFYFELLADPSFSIPNYESGIELYLKNIKPENSLKDLQDFIFGNCLLFRHYFLSKKLAKAKKLGKILFENLALTDQQISEIHVFPVARYLSCKLMYLDMKNNLVETFDFIEELHDFLGKRMTEISLHEQRILFYNIGEAYIFNGLITQQDHNQLKKLFAHLFDQLPSQLINQKLEKIVPYFNKNGSFLIHYLNQLE
jgi:hypothetical protein